MNDKVIAKPSAKPSENQIVWHEREHDVFCEETSIILFPISEIFKCGSLI